METQQEVQDVIATEPSSEIVVSETRQRKSSKTFKTTVTLKDEVLNFTKSLHWSTWVGVAASIGISIFFVIPNFRSAPSPKETSNPLRQFVELPAYDEAKFSENESAELDDLNQQFAYFLNEEQQRIRVQIALGYMAMATQSIRSGDCQTQIECLLSFGKARAVEIDQIIDQKEFSEGVLPTSDKQLMLVPLLQQLAANEKVEGWRLAVMLVKPADMRTPQEKWELETRYSILKSKLPVENLTPRPAMMQSLLKAIDKKRIALRASSPEEQARFDRRQKLCEQNGKCDGLK